MEEIQTLTHHGKLICFSGEEMDESHTKTVSFPPPLTDAARAAGHVAVVVVSREGGRKTVSPGRREGGGPPPPPPPPSPALISLKPHSSLIWA